MSEKTVVVKVQGTTETAGLDELLDLQGGLKTITQPNLGKLKAAIVAEGFIAPVFIWARGKRRYILDGHQRCRALTALRDEGWRIPPLPVVRIVAKDLADAKRKLLLIASQYGDVDKAEARTWALDLQATDIRLMTVELNLEATLPTKDDDEVPETARARVQHGEVWQLGDHRLMCGDSTSGEDVAVLMDGRLADMVFTDPPYGVAYRGKTKDSLTMAGDESPEAFVRAVEHFALVSGGAAYVCCPPGDLFCTFVRAFQTKCKLSSIVIWVKHVMVMGRADYHYRHEPILYGWEGTGKHRFHGDRSQTSVWEIDRPTRSKDHPTMKPVELVEKAIKNSSRAGELVSDPFLGSGTTLIACEKTGRTCYGMEIDPHYCDVIIKRYTEWCRANDREAVVKRIKSGDEDLFDGEAETE